MLYQKLEFLSNTPPYSEYFEWWSWIVDQKISESEVSLTWKVHFSFLNIGDNFGEDGHASEGCVSGAAMGSAGKKCRICMRSCRFWNNSSCLGFCLVILIFRALATLLYVERQDRPEDIIIISSGWLLLRLIFLLPRSFLKRYFLWIMIFCSRTFSWTFFGVLLMHWPSSVSRSCLVPILAISEFRTRTSGLFGSLIRLVVGLTFPTLLYWASTSYRQSKFSFYRFAAFIIPAILTWLLRSLRGIGLEISSNDISLASTSFVFLHVVGTGIHGPDNLFYFNVRTHSHFGVWSLFVRERGSDWDGVFV